MEENINLLTKERISKLKAMREMGIEPYGERYEVSHPIRELRDRFSEKMAVRIAGRIMAMREHGKSSFYDLKDRSGRIQIYLKEDFIGKEQYSFLKNLDIGDFIGVTGELFKTRTGEPTVKVNHLTVLSKSLRPLPEKWHGLKDVETRYRQRYVDLVVNDEVRDVFVARSRIVTEIRAFLDARGYLEVETPMMQPLAGGATGRPFRTHHEALGMDLFLRIAPELYLKRLVVGGLEKVYEINRNFRNEGISIRHNPEFTMLEVYTAYSDCEGTMALTEELITSVAEKVRGSKVLPYQGKTIDLTKWERVSFADLVKESFSIEPGDDVKTWVRKLKAKGVEIEGTEIGRTQIINIIGDLIEPKAGNHPVFVVDLFTELCPLAKTKKGHPELTDRFELYMGGMEVANAYSELNDPIEQKKRFEEQGGAFDEDFVRALEYGMPPAGGLGIGIDRLVMILTDSPSIRDVILFPQLKPEQ